MRFHSGAKLRKFKFTVRPASTVIIHGANGPVTEQVKPLRAIFKYGNDHTFDSIEAQKEFGWEDWERELVEKKLQDPTNGYIGRSDDRRIYLADVPQVQDVERDASGEVVKCIGMNIVDNQPLRCQNPAIAGGIYCDAHILAQTSEAPKVANCIVEIDPETQEMCGKPVIEGTDVCMDHAHLADPVVIEQEAV